ncbi:MAG: IS21-like element helper ATPase IstB [Euryarchaeota archaeon]|nr:IS21-like element helper ATPase IstB [Euryarchaeota archaeon]MDE1837982.1 IS21-like element helper ATPase IstB [Euryarchaeota archaeon]MDE1881396.1 IS21-like element helper ATPase IstB [Euryarchaeota archaeon]MDE2046420.1 IS21-like element helper ATPase IstB [Thermoplasmata archaeon]
MRKREPERRATRPATTTPSLERGKVLDPSPIAPESQEDRFRAPVPGAHPFGDGHLAYERLHANLLGVGLKTVEAQLDGYLQGPGVDEQSVTEILDHLLQEEVKARDALSLQLRLQFSKIPVRKTLEEFDLAAQPSIDPKVLEELRTLRFVHDHANVLLLGPPGVGKTHLAVALGWEALRAGFSVFFVSAPRLVEDLRRGAEVDRLDSKLRLYAKYGVLIVDEIGYLPMERVGAHLFFQLINARYEKGSTVFTSNKSFAEWGEVMGDTAIAAATLDRILHHATVVSIKGESYRLRSRRKSGLPTPSPLAPLQARA